MQGDSTAEKERFGSLPAVYQLVSGKEERDVSAVSGAIAESDLTRVDAPSISLFEFYVRLAATGAAGVVLLETLSRLFPLARETRDSKETPGPEGSA